MIRFGILPYAIGAALAAGAFILFLLWRLDQVSDARDRFKAANEANLSVIAQMKAEERRNEEILAQLRHNREAITRASDRQQRAIADLAEESADVRAYLDARIPADLAGLLWPDSPDADNPPNAPE